MKTLNQGLAQDQKLSTVANSTRVINLVPGTLHAGDDIGKGTLHAGDDIGEGTLHAGDDIGKGTLHAG